MGFYATDECFAVLDPCLENPTPPSKNRVWNFFETSGTCAGFSESQPVESHQEKWPTPTTTVSGVRYYGHRFYMPEAGRWCSRDPAEEDGGANLYGFCRNSPVDEMDMLGLAASGFGRSLSSGPTLLRDSKPSYSIRLWITLPSSASWPSAARRVWQLNHWNDLGVGVDVSGTVKPISRHGDITDNFESTFATGHGRMPRTQVEDVMGGPDDPPSGIVTTCFLVHVVEKKIGWNRVTGALLNTGTFGIRGRPLNPGDVLAMGSMREDAAAKLTYTYTYINTKDCNCQKYWASLFSGATMTPRIVEILDVPGVHAPWRESY